MLALKPALAHPARPPAALLAAPSRTGHRRAPGRRATGFSPAASEGSPQGGGDVGAAAPAPVEPAEPSIRDLLIGMEQLMAMQEDISKLAMTEDIGKLRDDIGEMRTQLGSVFNAFAAAVPDGRRRRVYRQPSQLAADCGLPHDTTASRRVLEELLRQHQGAYALRSLLLRKMLREQDDGAHAAVASWRLLPRPATAAEWEEEARVLGQVAAALKPGSEVQQAVPLLRKYSAEPDVALRLGHGAEGSLVLQETTLTAAGVHKATRQLRHALRLVAWLHHALGAPIPPLEGRIVVPATEVRAAERKLRVASRPVREWVPGGGAKFELCIKVASV